MSLKANRIPAEVVREFVRAFNDGDLDAFVAVLDPEIELHSMRGTRTGLEAARQWANRAPGGVQQSIAIDELLDHSAPDPLTVVVALVSRRWHWEEDGSFAGEDKLAWLFTLRDGLVLSWHPFEERAEGLRAAGLVSEQDNRPALNS